MKPHQYFGLWTILCSLDALSTVSYVAYFGLPASESNIFIKLIVANLGVTWVWFWFPIEWFEGIILVKTLIWLGARPTRINEKKIGERLPFLLIGFMTYVIILNFAFLARAFGK